ncbi:hypothetical protein CkaCkLH20_07879 [Colletotrichum karsti]|uniref:BTB domain-containing protein n=1 Tax=Colletotrichum karsti TaxID=1095194 RepID=A0A9P6LJN3_9PEZI|nr:uncharacterized protein CkaCkLH20_07879 [Colletotrichum karsti]KAF9874742.1 hypothetical protein CkaCkLH20_07879 [Colletotrichum karsti]
MSLKRKGTMEDIFQSRSIKFFVGTEGKEFSVHEASLGAVSGPLKALLSGGMKESLEGIVVWDDTESSTFLGLVEFAYTGDYSVPDLRQTDEPRPKHVTMASFSKKDQQDDPGVHFPSMLSEMNSDRSAGAYVTITDTRLKFCEKHFDEGRENPHENLPFARDMEKNDRTGYHGVFMHHAKLYVLADKYVAVTLKSLCLQRVRVSLRNVPGSPEFVDVLRDLVVYVYDNTTASDELRRLLVRYCVARVFWFKVCGFLQRMRKELPEFMADVLLEFTPSLWFELDNCMCGTYN